MNEQLSLKDAGSVAVLTLRRPMALDSAGKHAISAQIEQLAKRDDVRVLIITASDAAAFLVNVSELSEMDQVSAATFSQAGHQLANALELLPYPVIAAVEGAALGGGCELVLACDLAIAGAQATFGQIEALGGVMPGFGGTWRLARRVGFHRACAMMFTGEVIDAATAKSYGLVLDVSAPGGALAAAEELAARIVKASRASLAAIKRVTHAGWNLEPSKIDEMEKACFPTLFGPEQSARMQAFLKQQEAAEQPSAPAPQG